jgi:hypothetical protein
MLQLTDPESQTTAPTIAWEGCSDGVPLEALTLQALRDTVLGVSKPVEINGVKRKPLRLTPSLEGRAVLVQYTDGVISAGECEGVEGSSLVVKSNSKKAHFSRFRWQRDHYRAKTF